MFGVSVPYIGLSLTMGIVMGLAGSAGSLIPLFQIENASSQPSFPYIIGGLVISLVGVAITAKAGIDRDKLISTNNNSNNIVKGILIAVICGLLSSLLNVGFANAAPIAEKAQEYGVIARNSSLASWVVVLWGAFMMNFGYAIFLLIKNNFVRVHPTNEYSLLLANFIRDKGLEPCLILKFFFKIKFNFNDWKTMTMPDIYFLNFDDLPEPAKRYINIKAARVFVDRSVTDDALRTYTQQDEIRARSVLLDSDTKNDDCYILIGDPSLTGRFGTYTPSQALIRE